MAHWETIPGWFDFSTAYDDVVQNYPGGVLVEVGCYLGRSLCYLGQLVKDSGKPFSVVGVEWGRGSGVENGNDNHGAEVAKGGGTLAGTLHRNLIDCGVADFVTLIVADSAKAANLFADNSLTFVFLDAAHDYESVKRDLKNWLPKVAVGGTIGGDDYCPVWPGVIQAVNELLPAARPWSHDSWRWIKN